MWQGYFAGEVEQALADRVQRPGPAPAPPRASVWSQVGALLSAPATGAAQAVNESARIFGRVLSARPQDDPPERRAQRSTLMSDAAAMREQARRKHDETLATIDEQLRSGADYWKPDPHTASWASSFLHDASRMITKVAGYGLAGGVPGAVAGSAIDEGGTAYLGLRDKGVDAGTAAQVGAVRGVVTGASVLAPVAGRTIAQTAGIVAASGPGAFMAEQALSREILQRAGYRELAAEHDPWDATGLALSLVPGAAIGVGVHAVRARRAKGDARGIDGASLDALADDPDAVAAAHVQLRRDTIADHSLSPVDDLAALSAHERALSEARAALDEGRPMQIAELPVDVARATQAEADMVAKLRSAAEGVPPDADVAPPAARMQPEDVADPMARPEVVEALRLLDDVITPRLGDRAAIERALADVKDALPHNLAVGLMENGTSPAAQRRMLDEYARRVADAERSAKQTPESLVELAADLVEDMRRGVEGRAARQGPMQRAQATAADKPALPVRLTEDGPAAPAGELLASERAAAQQDLSQSRRAFEAAIECVLKFGE